jgi:hypothetical protein
MKMLKWYKKSANKSDQVLYSAKGNILLSMQSQYASS